MEGMIVLMEGMIVLMETVGAVGIAGTQQMMIGSLDR